MSNLAWEGIAVLKAAEREDQVKLRALREAIIAGEKSGVYQGDVIGEIGKRIRRRALAKGNENA